VSDAELFAEIFLPVVKGVFVVEVAQNPRRYLGLCSGEISTVMA
jgi:hypothetical protein